MGRSKVPLCFLVLICASLLVSTWCHSSSKHVALFIFGDSLFDAGNNQYLKSSADISTFWPYGVTFFKHPTGRLSDGRLVPDFIAEYANLPFIPPYLQLENYQSINGGYFVSKGARVLVDTHQGMLCGAKIQQLINGVNFASAGAGALVETHQGLVIDLQTQLGYFKNVVEQLKQELGDTEAKKLFSTAVYMFSIGGNDYFQALTPNNSLPQFNSKEEFVGMVIGNLKTVIQEIHRKGGRKFGFLNMTPLGCLPFQRAIKQDRTGVPGCMDEATQFTKLHIRALPKALKELETQLEGFKYSIFDAYTAGMERINNPSKYGFKEVEKACCGGGSLFGCGQEGCHLCKNASEYFFFDSSHPTEFTNSQLAKLMWSGNLDIVEPYNLKTLFGD